ncbi:ricin b lectin-like protein [Plasmopara halstedii]|uniref:glucan endo-1,3-beta-D-glucosidase n=1 Tax=Plasmopara halstedii TaxID=4781 RepID=A0A0P1AMQ3_PLAHL|nr:ricin b lectin-like protein [Plasmopara halstedii]CEG42348.1 ricin b lectin-like protein [Plasmopara halstedii]|eukprot:XP_024578717.1 ricin b lectin-like protein [Plasmopara halstedii]
MKFFLRTSAISAVFMLPHITDALNVRMYGMNYNTRKGCDWEPENIKCKSATEVQRDLYALKTVTDRVRIYSLVDCNQAEHVLPAAKNAGLQVELGIWTTASHDFLLQEKAKLAWLIDTGLYDNNVIALHVGSETIYRKEITATTAINYMNEIRDYLRSRGFQTPVTIADVIDIYYENPQLVDMVDFIAVNMFSYWEGVHVNDGTSRTLDRIRAIRVTAVNKNKVMILSEVGWSSGGYNTTTGESSPAAQAKFFSEFFQIARASNILFYWYTAFDSEWRVRNGGYDVERHFGVFREDGSMKPNFEQLQIGWMEPTVIRSSVTNMLLSTKDESIFMSAKVNDWLVKEQQTWFFDQYTQQVRSQYSDHCLDAYQPWDGGIVHPYSCIDDEKNQKWRYDKDTNKLVHATYNGMCLDVDPARNNIVQLYGCSPNNPNQQWVVLTWSDS